MTNERVKIAMMRAGITQAQLADLLKVSSAELSVMLKYELSAKTQSDIIARIKEESK